MDISAGFAHPVQNRDALEIPGLKRLWTETPGDPRICVAVLDGPVDLAHQAFKGANLTQIEALTAASDGPAAQHGTHVASLIFGQHDSPIAGISPSCRGLLIPIFSQITGGSPAQCSQVDLARAILQAVDAGANIINVSGGQYTSSGTAHPILADVVQRCAREGVLIFAAAGNQGCDCMHIPGALPSVLAVGAMNAAGEPLQFSNWGST
jgi:subtilisin family serine protease